jgi:AcrR family transcriptional regulator
MATAVKGKRRYDSSRRQELARQNRQAILAASRELFLENGYAATTVGRIATEAGLSVETVYKAFGNKPGLAKAVFDVTVVGDDEAVPMAERPEIKVVEAEPDARKKIELFFETYPARRSRTAAIERMIRDAAATDAGAAAVRDELVAELRRGMTMFASHLVDDGGTRPELTVDDVADILYTYVSLDFYELLMARGWSQQRYARFVTDALIAALTEHQAGPTSPCR